jgi:hypothetical protein
MLWVLLRRLPTDIIALVSSSTKWDEIIEFLKAYDAPELDLTAQISQALQTVTAPRPSLKFRQALARVRTKTPAGSHGTVELLLWQAMKPTLGTGAMLVNAELADAAVPDADQWRRIDRMVGSNGTTAGEVAAGFTESVSTADTTTAEVAAGFSGNVARPNSDNLTSLRKSIDGLRIMLEKQTEITASLQRSMGRDASRPPRTVGSATRGCFRCGATNHWARECPRQGTGAAPQGCFTCGERGHYARDCMKSQPRSRPYNQTAKVDRPALNYSRR